MVDQIANAALPGPAGRDHRAVPLARALRDAVDAECVILFGSRARADWSEHSDLDLMIIEPAIPELNRRQAIAQTAQELADRAYRKFIPIDFVYLSRAEYERKSVHTINHVSRFASREGAIMPRHPEDFANNSDPDDRSVPSDERIERAQRIADTNMHYDTMHLMLDVGMTNKNTVYNAHRTLEHAMKALISAQGCEYPHHHRLDRLALRINENAPGLNWRPGSNLLQLNHFAGGSRDGPLLAPVADFTEMANRVTDDLNRIYGEITKLTGENPWAVPPEGSLSPTRPRCR